MSAKSAKPPGVFWMEPQLQILCFTLNNSQGLCFMSQKWKKIRLKSLTWCLILLEIRFPSHFIVQSWKFKFPANFPGILLAVSFPGGCPSSTISRPPLARPWCLPKFHVLGLAIVFGCPPEISSTFVWLRRPLTFWFSKWESKLKRQVEDWIPGFLDLALAHVDSQDTVKVLAEDESALPSATT